MQQAESDVWLVATVHPPGAVTHSHAAIKQREQGWFAADQEQCLEFPFLT
jgi:hypothetical protein